MEVAGPASGSEIPSSRARVRSPGTARATATPAVTAMTTPITNLTLRTVSVAEVRAATVSTTMAGMPARATAGRARSSTADSVSPGTTTPSTTGTAARLRAAAARYTDLASPVRRQTRTSSHAEANSSVAARDAPTRARTSVSAVPAASRLNGDQDDGDGRQGVARGPEPGDRDRARGRRRRTVVPLATAQLLGLLHVRSDCVGWQPTHAYRVHRHLRVGASAH